MFLIFSLVLIVALILNFQLLNQVKAGVDPTGFLKKNLFDAYVKNSASMGQAYYAVFYLVYGLLGIGALFSGYWLSAILIAAYMFVNYKFFAIMIPRLAAHRTPQGTY